MERLAIYLFNSNPLRHREMFDKETYDKMSKSVLKEIRFAWFHDRDVLRNRMRDSFHAAVAW